MYTHRQRDGATIKLSPGKALCVGRNYLAHIKELDNAVPAEPLLFAKGNNSFQGMDEEILIPARFGLCHHEVELALLIKHPIHHQQELSREHLWGLGLALDLTLRDKQTELKAAGLPWEKAKAFDGACVLSPFVPISAFEKLDTLRFGLEVNNHLRQEGNTSAMIFPVFELLKQISEYFTLLPGDVVLTGSPAGVSALEGGDKCRAFLEPHLDLSFVVSRP